MISVAHEDTQTSVETRRTIPSLVLGDIHVTDDLVMRFSTPLWGFPSHSEFALLPAARAGLWWLQSLTGEGITFLLADPFVLEQDYEIDLGETERKTLQIEQPSDALGLVMVTLPQTDNEGATANFRAPLVFNVAQRTGLQVVSRDEAHELRRHVTLDVFPAQEQGLRMR